MQPIEDEGPAGELSALIAPLSERARLALGALVVERALARAPGPGWIVAFGRELVAEGWEIAGGRAQGPWAEDYVSRFKALLEGRADRKEGGRPAALLVQILYLARFGAVDELARAGACSLELARLLAPADGDPGGAEGSGWAASEREWDALTAAIERLAREPGTGRQGFLDLLTP